MFFYAVSEMLEAFAIVVITSLIIDNLSLILKNKFSFSFGDLTMQDQTVRFCLFYFRKAKNIY